MQEDPKQKTPIHLAWMIGNTPKSWLNKGERVSPQSKNHTDNPFSSRAMCPILMEFPTLHLV